MKKQRITPKKRLQQIKAIDWDKLEQEIEWEPPEEIQSPPTTYQKREKNPCANKVPLEARWSYMGRTWMIWSQSAGIDDLKNKGFVYIPASTSYRLEIGGFLRLDTIPSYWQLPNYEQFVQRIVDYLPVMVYWNFKSLKSWINTVQRERRASHDSPPSLEPVMKVLTQRFYDQVFNAPHPDITLWLPGVEHFPSDVRRRLLGPLIIELQSFARHPRMVGRPKGGPEKARNSQINQFFKELRHQYGWDVDPAMERLKQEYPDKSEVNLRKIAGTTRARSDRRRQSPAN